MLGHRVQGTERYESENCRTHMQAVRVRAPLFHSGPHPERLAAFTISLAQSRLRCSGAFHLQSMRINAQMTSR